MLGAWLGDEAAPLEGAAGDADWFVELCARTVTEGITKIAAENIANAINTCDRSGKQRKLLDGYFMIAAGEVWPRSRGTRKQRSRIPAPHTN